MKTLRLCVPALLLCTTAMLTSCKTRPISPASSPPPAEIMQKQYLYEIVRYLYRWQLDDAEINQIYENKDVVFWVERLNPQLDPGDHSVLAQIVLPQLNLSVKVKKADYRIEELNTTVRSGSFRIVRVSRGDLPDHRPANAVEIKLPLQQIRDYLFNTRNQRDYPDAALIERLRVAARAEVSRELNKSVNVPTTDQTIYLAPLSPVANDLWVFWEDRNMLFYFSSDIDLSNPAVWDQESLAVRVFDIDQQVVASHEEAPGSNRFLTRNQVGRLLYNCVVLGRKITLKPLASLPAGSAPAPTDGQ
ncbi:MAG TPA: hypothetical protein VFY06_11760 [Verrucomicrobiae bacterium]|nr:hypothetical protein [Verrucomicrobiae bacterium]